ncbi:metal ABC transporter solute-binding protein, Zn/Mn family [Amnibacterium endophyticum]|uniref:Metal ABC transporter solute-binding protein, Zn/Mn family n=1 Tax=Amnibacterium endophyticum TaxID=2109337 RepID=A0ABW4LAF8_9MICO
MRRLLPLALLPALVLAGCSGTAGSPAASSSASDGRVSVVASTDVWGDVVKQVGGSDVAVTSIIDDPTQDPHEYQATTRDQLAVSRAGLVVVNGGGYDDFLSQLLKNAPGSTKTLNAVDASGLDTEPADGEFNEHVWYDLPAVSKVAAAVSAELSRIDPSGAATFESNLQTFQGRLKDLEATAADIRRTAEGKGVAITEPVPLYMTEALGLVNKTPEAFSEAVEEGDDVAPAVLKEELDLLREQQVAVLAYNEQTSDSTTEQVLAAAKRAGVPVVGVRETLPSGKDYLAWMQDDLQQFRSAVA